MLRRRAHREAAGRHASTSDLPAGGEVSSPFGRLKLAFQKSGDTVTARTEFSVRATASSPSEYPAFRRWVEAADQLLKQRIGLRKDEERR